MNRRLKCRPLPMPEIFRWGDTNPHWDHAVDQYMALRSANRLCDHINQQARRNGFNPS